jgi:hypothetical protein
MNVNPKYTTNLAKGQGIIPETMALLSAWHPGMRVVQLKSLVLKQGIIPKATALRTEDIVGRLFSSRYLVNDAQPARNLKTLVESSFTASQLSRLFLIYTCRAHRELHDFITQVYWTKYAAGASMISTQDARDFLYAAMQEGKSEKPWSETMRIRVARYLTGCLTDFQLAGPDQKGVRTIIPFHISNLATQFLAHDLHFSGLNDNSIMTQEDWQLFGLAPSDVLRELQRSADGHFIPQFAGDLLRISWKHKTMEEFLHALIG